MFFFSQCKWKCRRQPIIDYPTIWLQHQRLLKMRKRLQVKRGKCDRYLRPPAAIQCVPMPTKCLPLFSHFAQMRFSIWLGLGPKCLRIKFAWKSVYIDREWPMQMFAGQMNGQWTPRTVDTGRTDSGQLRSAIAPGANGEPTLEHRTWGIGICLRQCSLGIYNTQPLAFGLPLFLPNVISSGCDIIIHTHSKK